MTIWSVVGCVKPATQLRKASANSAAIEKRSDLLLSTLRKTVEAMGGNLSLVVEFPDRAPVVLSGIAGDEPPRQHAGGKHARAPSGFGDIRHEMTTLPP